MFFSIIFCALAFFSTPATAEPLSKAALMGKVEPKKEADFEKIPAAYSTKTDLYLRKATLAAFKQMYAAAKKEGITLQILSATRTFNDQKAIWEAKWNNKYANIKDPNVRARTILLYSSMPGSSRHHWGTDMDLNDLNNTYFERDAGKKCYEWLTAHAAEYGFCQVYSPKNAAARKVGYEEEKWHWSYLPLAKQYLAQYKTTITYADFAGFEGAPTAQSLRIIEDYVSGIGAACQ
jgi:zinc D-Ala-D-Ala carboxypeptidase